MRNSSFKEYQPDASQNLSELILTNIGLKTSLSPLSSLMVTAAGGECDTARFAFELATELARQNKRVLLIDLNRQGLRFKKLLGRDFEEGFTDFLHHVFDEPFLSHNVSDYGFVDLLALCHFNRRSGQVLFIPEDDDPVAVRFYEGYPVDIVNASKTLYRAIVAGVAELTGVDEAGIESELATLKDQPLHYTDKLTGLSLIPPELLGPLYDIQTARILKELAQKSFVSFDFAGQPNEIYASVRRLFVDKPSFLKGPLSDQGHIARQLAKCTVRASQGLTFFPMGRFPAKKGELARQFQGVLALLKRRFDFILVNAPEYAEDSLAAEVGPILAASVVVVKSGALERRQLRTLMTSLRESGLNLVGAVLSDVPASNGVVI